MNNPAISNESCPGTQHLEQFLNDQLDAKQRTRIADHVEKCSHCQAQLEELTVDPWRDAQQPQSSDNASLQSLMQRLQRQKSPFLDGDTQPNTPHPNTLSHNAGFTHSQNEWLGKSLDQYRLLEQVGHGGSGVVYRAFDTKLNRTVAIKMLHRHLVGRSDTLQRLVREARSIASLTDPHVLQLLEYKDAGDSAAEIPYLVTEYVDGRSLRQEIDQHGALDLQWTAKTVRDIACGLHAAHQQSLVHRDIKPSNILLDIASDAPKVADFGLAIDEKRNSRITLEGVVCGTPAYMSPEQVATDREIDRRSDVYSLGVVLYECLTGEVPFRGIAAMTLDRITHELPREPRMLNPSVPRDLNSICLAAIQKLPEKRYPTADALAQDLERWLSGKPTVARPVSTLTKVLYWTRQNRLVALLMGLIAVLFVAWIVGAAANARRLELANQQQAELIRQQIEQAQSLQEQKKSLLATVQQLVYRVNDTLEYEEIDTDLLQKQLLRISLRGLQSAAAAAHGHGTERGKADIHLRLAVVLMRLGETDSSAENFARCKSILQKMEIDELSPEFYMQARCDFWLVLLAAETSIRNANPSSSTRSLREALERLEKTANRPGAPDELVEDLVYGSISATEYMAYDGQFEVAEEILRSALQIARQYRDRSDEVNIGFAAGPAGGYMIQDVLATLVELARNSESTNRVQYAYWLTRHSIEMMPQGYEVTGIELDSFTDNSHEYFQNAIQELAEIKNPTIEQLYDLWQSQRMLGLLFLLDENWPEAERKLRNSIAVESQLFNETIPDWIDQQHRVQSRLLLAETLAELNEPEDVTRQLTWVDEHLPMMSDSSDSEGAETGEEWRQMIKFWQEKIRAIR